MTEEPPGLSPLVQHHIDRLFPAGQRADVLHLLIESCGPKTLYRKMDWSAILERVQCAILRLSNGKMENLHKAIELYHADWNELLCAANFEKDVNAHKVWEAP
jgi:hypothetical protein